MMSCLVIAAVISCRLLSPAEVKALEARRPAIQAAVAIVQALPPPLVAVPRPDWRLDIGGWYGGPIGRGDHWTSREIARADARDRERANWRTPAVWLGPRENLFGVVQVPAAGAR